MESKEKIFNYFMETSKELEERCSKKEIELNDYMCVKGVLLGLIKAYVWTYGEDENWFEMLDQME